MADKQDKGAKPEKQPKADQSPETLARAEKARGAKEKAAVAAAFAAAAFSLAPRAFSARAKVSGD